MVTEVSFSPSRQYQNITLKYVTTTSLEILSSSSFANILPLDGIYSQLLRTPTDVPQYSTHPLSLCWFTVCVIITAKRCLDPSKQLQI
jgi:hypothetical protein